MIKKSRPKTNLEKSSSVQGKRLRATANSELSPFVDPFGSKIGDGQDNTVRVFENVGHLVVKISKQKGKEPRTRDEEWRSILYKKKKYEILKMFLGDFIPKSSFVISHKTDGINNPRPVIKGYTIQQRVPQYQIDSLSTEQQRDPRLLNQLYILMRKLHNMYSAIDEVNKVTGSNTLDGKLDLGKVSKYVKEEYEPGERRNFDPSVTISKLRNSPNLLIDPNTMCIYCVDFDDGQWDDSKDAALGVLRHIVDTQPDVQEIINLK